jgi:hypothetical protein
MGWIGEGPHMALLEDLIALEVDPLEAGVNLFASWPRPCSQNWRCVGITPDPFFIEAMTLLFSKDPGTYCL